MTAARAFLLTLMCASTLSAQTPESGVVERPRSLTQYSYQQWDDRDGLPQNSVQAIATSKQGYLWLGTQLGVARYDGVRFKVFDGDNTPALKKGYVWALEPDANGGVWIGTEEGGLIHEENGKFTAITKANGLTSNWVQSLKTDRAGNLWIGMLGSGGLMVRRPNGALEKFNEKYGFKAKNVFAIAEDTAGIIWVGTPLGLIRIRNNSTKLIEWPKDFSAKAVSGLAARKGGGVYAAVVGVGVALVRNDSVELISRLDTAKTGYVRAMTVDDVGAIWLGTQRGLARLIGRELSMFPQGSGPQNEVAALRTDNEGSLWVGLDGGGLARLRSTPITGFGKPEGLASDMVFPVFQDRSGAVWIGTGGAGVDRFVDGKITHFTLASGHLPNDNVISINQGPDGAIWIGTFAGMSRIVNDRATIYNYKNRLLPGLIRFIYFDRHGSLWVATHNGLQRYMPGPPQVYTTKDGLADNFVTSMIEDRNGTIWLSTRSGINKLENGRITQTIGVKDGLPDRGVNKLYEDGNGAIWITTDAGLARMRNGRIQSVSAREGLCANDLTTVIEDNKGRLWFGSHKGIFSIEKSDFDDLQVSCRLLERAAGMRAREANGMVNPAGWKMQDGRIWFPTIRGVAIVDPDNTRLDLNAPPVEIEEIARNGRDFEVHYAGLSFVSPEQMQFRYKLEGYDDKWVNAGSRRVAYFSGLKPGNYTFRVQAANAEGVWNTAGAMQHFSIAPFWYETVTFRFAVLLAFLGTVALLYRRRIHKLQQRQQVLFDLAEERGRAEARYRELFENATDAVFTTNANGDFTAANKKTLQLTGYEEDEILKLNVRDLLPKSEAGERIAKIWLSGHADGAERITICNKTGERVPIEVSTRVLRDDENVIGLQAIARDMTDRAALERQLRQSQKMEAVGQLAGGVAHDFNNLLTVIRGNGELALQELPLEDPVRADIEEINMAAERASGLTRQLLAFSRKQVVHPRALDLNNLLRDMDKMLRRLIGEDVSIVTLPSMQSACVVADPTQLEQVLVNLVVNARDAMPRGGTITIETSIMDVGDLAHAPVRSGSGKAVVLSVTDTGLGMDASTQSRIFEPFFTTKETGKGTGLGLSTVYGIVQQADGQIVCNSQLGKGTSFKIYLPYAPDGVSGTDEETSVTVRPGDETILLVEDEDAVRSLASKVLRQNGYRVIEARHGQDALVASTDFPGHVDLLLSDVVLPAMNGRVLAEMLMQTRPDLRVLLMSGYTDDEIVRRGLLDPGMAFLSKPFTPHALLRMVRDVLDSELGAAAD